MKKWLVLSLLCISAHGMASNLCDYNKIRSAVVAGKRVHFVVDFTKCTVSGNRLSQLTDAIGVYTPNEIAVTPDRMATAMLHFTIKRQEGEPDKPQFEFARYTLTPDNNMRITAQILDPTYTIVPDLSATWDCKINDAAKVYN